MTERALDLVRSSDVRDARCPYCRVAFGEEEPWLCSRCATPHHRECARENGHCTILGCTGRLGLVNRTPVVFDSEPRPLVPDRVVVVALALLAVVVSIPFALAATTMGGVAAALGPVLVGLVLVAAVHDLRVRTFERAWLPRALFAVFRWTTLLDFGLDLDGRTDRDRP